MRRPWRNTAYRLLPIVCSACCLIALRITCPGGTTHSELGPLGSIIIQETVPQAPSRQLGRGYVLSRVSSSQKTRACVRLTKKQIN